MKKNRLVIKQGSSFFDHNKYHRRDAIGGMANKIKDLNYFYNVSLVHSGAVLEGIRQYNEVAKPVRDVSPNVLAAVGSAAISEQIRMELIVRRMMSAQLLLTHSEIDNPKHSEALISTIESLESEDIIPLINANDALEREELNKLPEGGDNDDLAASLAIKLGAKALLLCTDVDGFMVDGEVQKKVSISEIESLSNHIYENGDVGTGGMYSKLKAGAKAVEAGVKVVIGNGEADYLKILANQAGTQVVQ